MTTGMSNDDPDVIRTILRHRESSDIVKITEGRSRVAST
jgi:hypothetical protein